MSRDFFPVITTRTVNTVQVLVWVLFGVLGSFWWVPKYLGEEHPISLTQGAGAVVLLWALTFNDLPRIGFKAFFNTTPLLRLKIAILAIISVLFLVGTVL